MMGERGPWRNGEGYAIEADPARLDRERIVRFLSEEAWWSKGRPRAVIEASIDNAQPFGLYDPSGAQIGFARVVSDRATFAWLADVFVLPEHRGKGLARWLVATILAYPDFAGVRWLLATRDMQEVYRPHGFSETPPGRFMVRTATPRTAGEG